ncbi:MAG: M20/M25/M40 family metallo-hydrolase, partial [Pseudomonadota bacterium]
NGAAAGPTVMIRCELDALPIHERSDRAHRSRVPGKAHLCGHDGHMSMVVGLALILRDRRPSRGRVVLMFQPAEETGVGAAAVISSPGFAEIAPDYAFALHNVPRLPLGAVGICSEVANCASRGMRVVLIGKSSHAAAPEDGMSPAPAMAALMEKFASLGAGGMLDRHFTLSTLTHARLGKPSFGIAPGEGELLVTLRSMTDEAMATMVATAERHIVMMSGNLDISTTWHDIFYAVENGPEAVAVANRAVAKAGLRPLAVNRPMRWSEDFGRFAQAGAQSAMIFIGSGEDQPQLHNPDFDFPDALIPFGTHLFLQIIDQLLEI